MLHAVDVMSRPVVSARSSTPLREAGTVLADYGYAGLPVVDESGCLLGIVTCGDVLRAGRRLTSLRQFTRLEEKRWPPTR